MASDSKFHVYGVLSRVRNGKKCENVKAPLSFQIIKDKITIGRVNCDLTVVSTFMSRLHAEIKLNNNTWTIIDKSVNGVLLNGQLIEKGKTKELKSNDIIGFGGNPELDISYVLILHSKNETRAPTTSKKLTTDTKSNIIVLDDGENEGPSDRKRRREISPDKQTLLEKNKELEEKMLRLEFELEKKEEEARKEIEIQRKAMNLKEQEYELKLKMNAVNEKQDNDRIEALKAELKSTKAANAKMESSVEKLQTDKTKEIALELERAGLEWTLGEKNRTCQKLESQLTEARKKLEEKEKTQVPATQSSPHTSKISSTVENELQCSICSELFIKATTLSCSHSFCEYCINQWNKTKKECPMCRKAIASAVPSIALDNFISQFIATLSPHHQEKRKEVVEERKAIAAAASVPKTTKKSAANNNGPQQATRLQTVNRTTITNTGNNNFHVVTRVNVQSRSNAGPSVIVNTAIDDAVVIHDSDSDISEDDSSPSDDTSSSNDDSFISYDENYDSSDSATPYYGGYGACYKCGNPGHWSNNCPN